jgi:hypothetical protein
MPSIGETTMNAAALMIPGASADHAPDERVRRTRRDAVVPGDEIPADRADQRAEDQLVVDERGFDDSFANRCRDLELEELNSHLEESERQHVEHRSPDDRLPRFEHARGDDRRDGIRGVVKAIHEIEGQCEQHQQDQRQRDRAPIH